MNQLEWRAIPGFEGRYEVSSNGLVRSLRGCRYLPPGEIYQHPVTRYPKAPTYMQVTLWIGTKPYSRRVHRLVLEAFVGPRPPGMVCCHTNGNSKDNRLENLRWDTQKANISDAILIGTHPFGTSHGRAKLDDEKVRLIRSSSLPATRLARMYGVSDVMVGLIRKRRAWRHVE